MRACRICTSVEVETINKFLIVDRSPRFISERWRLPRRAVKRHLDTCLTLEKRNVVVADLLRIAGPPGPKEPKERRDV